MENFKELLENKIFHKTMKRYNYYISSYDNIKYCVNEMYDIPDIKVIHSLLYYFQFLNYFVKYQDFPLSKTKFYNLKHHFLVYLMLLEHPDIKWDIDSKIEYQILFDKTIIFLIGINFRINDKIYTFHQKLEDNLLGRLLYDKIKDFPFEEYVYNPSFKYNNAVIKVQTIIDCWTKIYTILETNNWFIFNYLQHSDWVGEINKKYPKLDLHYSKIKLSSILSNGLTLYKNHIKKNGEKIQVRFKAVQWRKNFYIHLKEFSLLQKYNIFLKENIDNNLIIKLN